MSKHRLVVRPHRPYRNGIIYTVLAVLIAAAITGAFEFGRIRAGFDASEADARRAALAGDLDLMERQNRELRERIALLERSSEIDSESRTQIQANLTSMQDEVLELREELAFYRGIVSPEDAKAGLRVQSFRLQAGPNAELFHFRLVLIQAIQHDRRASGKVEVTVHGVKAGKPDSIALAELVTGDADKFDYSFKYFQDFEGDIRLPEGFEPVRVEVAVLPKGRSGEAIKRSFDWAQVIG